MRKWQHLWRLLPLAIVMLALAGCGKENLSALRPQGDAAEMQFSLMALSLYIMIGVLLVVAVLYVIVLFRFRRRPGQENIVPKQVEGNHTLEFIWTVIPIILLIVLAVPTVKQTFLLDNMAAEAEENGNAIQVKVTAHQFWWEFQYPDANVRTSQEVVIPTGTDVQFDLTSVDVLHAFWIPALAGKQDNSVQGSNRLWVKTDKPGVYQGRCTELCGASHALMNFKVKAVSPEEFDRWVDSMKTPAYTNVDAAGQEVFQKNCIACHAIGGEGATTAPDLTNFGDRDFIAGYLAKDAENKNLERWIRTPHKVKEGALMPGFNNLSDQDMSALIDYLNNLKVEQ